MTDALAATKAAVAHGYVAGGGVALLYASQVLDNLKLGNIDEQVGVRIVRDAIRIPCATIANNSGLNGEVLVAQLLDRANGNPFSTFGWNASSSAFVDMINAGIIDPFAVVQSTLEGACSVSSMLLTSEVSITKDKQI